MLSGPQIVENCRQIAERQYPDDDKGARDFEIQLLRTKVLELKRRVDMAETPEVAA